MVKRSKKYREAAERVDRNNLYTANEAIALLKSMPSYNFDQTVEAVFRLSVDPRKADQLVRGTVNPKTGTVTMDVTKAVKDIKGGKIEFRVDKNGNLSFLIGKMSFDESALDENFKAVADEVKRLKPSTVKGRYLTKATITSTMNPGVPVDPNTLA